MGAAGPGLLFSGDAAAAAAGAHTLVHVFLRGGMDGLNLVVPLTAAGYRSAYEAARPTLKIPTGTGGAIELRTSGAATGYGLHPAAAGLAALWNAGNLAIVHACGMLGLENRSHFDTQRFLDLGMRSGNAGTGWITRAWEETLRNGGSGAPLPLLGVNSLQPPALAGSNAVTLSSPAQFALNAGFRNWQVQHNAALGGLWPGRDTSALRTGQELNGRNADLSLQLIGSLGYVPYSTDAPVADWSSATAPDGVFKDQMWTVAQSIAFDVGLRYATVDLGGWDTHDAQGTVDADDLYNRKVDELSRVLKLFHDEMAARGLQDKVTVVVQSEFGRRVAENGNGGTDHGYGNALLVFGGQVAGGRFHGTPANLGILTSMGDIPVTTAYQQVLSDLLIGHMGLPAASINTVFPDYAGPTRLGIAKVAASPQSMDRAAVAPAGNRAVYPGETAGNRILTPDWQRRGFVERMITRREH